MCLWSTMYLEFNSLPHFVIFRGSQIQLGLYQSCHLLFSSQPVQLKNSWREMDVRMCIHRQDDPCIRGVIYCTQKRPRVLTLNILRRSPTCRRARKTSSSKPDICISWKEYAGDWGVLLREQGLIPRPSCLSSSRLPFFSSQEFRTQL